MTRELEPGEHGEVMLTPAMRTTGNPERLTRDGGRYLARDGRSVKPDLWIASAYYNDGGKLRRLTRQAVSATSASDALRDALRGWQDAATSSDVTSETTVAELADKWWSHVTMAGQLSSESVKLYRLTLDRHVIPGVLSRLRVRQVTAGKVHGFLQALVDPKTGKGRGSAKTARTVLRGMFSLAVSNGAVRTNPVREADPVRAPRAAVRAVEAERKGHLTDGELSAVLTTAETDPKHVRRDMADLLYFLAGTGVRVGEALALRWNDVDLEAGIVSVGARTVVRVAGEGLVISEHGSTKMGDRGLKMPPWLTARLLDRRVRMPANDLGIVFPTATYETHKRGAVHRGGTLRDPSNTAKHVRAVFESSGVTLPKGQGSHLFRKTVATRMVADGRADRMIANQLGHSSTKTTRDAYQSRKVYDTGAAELTVSTEPRSN
ncbi:tyrosine-type recombinase/integrase [Isoptericola sp. NPDC057559]|uniref:tyrosine-type recombinase/integrase n=1 Tax=Isoptericola sp. NPDC057559 TaxID=3346168 RepID=UPI0036C4B250